MNSINYSVLTEDVAKVELENFKSESFNTLQEMIGREDVNFKYLDYTTASIYPFFDWILEQLKVVPMPNDSSLPNWITSEATYIENLFDFDDHSKGLIAIASYYLGETFIRQFDNVKWNIGRKGTIDFNMPVLTGFKNGVNLPVLIVCENVFRKNIKSKSNSETFKTITAWIDAI